MSKNHFPGLLANRCGLLLLAMVSEEPSLCSQNRHILGSFNTRCRKCKHVYTLSCLSKYGQVEMCLTVIADYLLQVRNNCAV